MNTTTQHNTSSRHIAAFLRRQKIASAVEAWMATCPTDHEADEALKAALIADDVHLIHMFDEVEEIWSDAPETLMLRLKTGTLIEIDVESGNSLRGMADK